MLTFDAAVGAADKAAGAVWRAAQGPNSFGWRDGLAVKPPFWLAQFVAANRGANAERLYRFATAADSFARPFDRVPPALRVAVETFRATFLVLLEEMEKGGAVATPPAQPASPVHLKAREDAKLRRLEDAWDRDSGRPAKRQRKEVRP